ncbi:maleylacetoacetate isomerase [Pseudoponticoccus marisrubri]|uniref:Maleylacetoacetate isomerase n=1 Tax=Pseudoponticoccus marisrubri TaxID=1685382 RepID=A0A0W7WP03_9RHOB|nr:maleylacetoacetate isomerase [Pseudoponticoccus marisrubri]KUF12319.1 maleylacetoacetate isomerase [Pseudoponticoccus marisrubri]
MTLRLHNYFRSSTSTRLRAALNLKGLDYDYVAYALRDDAHRQPDFLARNPAGLVPVLETSDGHHLTQSLAIIEWLDETYPAPPLLPADAGGRARVRALAGMIACEVHPLNNLRVLRQLERQFGADAAAQAQWFTHWVTETFDALETMLAGAAETGRYCHGAMPGLADICLYAQVWNNRRFDIETARWPTIARIFAALDQLDAFRRAAPDAQPDAT